MQRNQIKAYLKGAGGGGGGGKFLKLTISYILTRL